MCLSLYFQASIQKKIKTLITALSEHTLSQCSNYAEALRTKNKNAVWVSIRANDKATETAYALASALAKAMP